jgi:beta-lactamase superfamily II metal-dependent hydrolase
MPSKKVTKATRSGKKKEIEIRMYNVGFGDSFLLRIPTTGGERRILVDCGFHSQGKGKFTDQDLVSQIKKDLRGEALDVVIATHRHQDHISGFGETAAWADIAVNEVWLPFTMGPKAVRDEPALAGWNMLLEKANGLWDSNGTLTPTSEAALKARPVERAAAEFMLWNARANAPAIQNLLTGMRRADGRPSTRRFLPEEKDPYPCRFVTPVLPGVSVHVLGPPIDAKFRKQQKVPASWGFDQQVPGDPGGGTGSPFSAEWQIATKRLPPHRPFADKTLVLIRQFNDDLLYAARALDGFLNGESLVLVLEVGSARLLFPGDAEVGSWTTIMNNSEALDLAASATFLKVGHHGSHNATPVSFIREHLPTTTPAVISTLAGAGNYRNGIPFDKLLEAMTTRSISFVRSDEPPASPEGVFKPGPEGNWIDCYVPC